MSTITHTSVENADPRHSSAEKVAFPGQLLLSVKKYHPSMAWYICSSVTCNVVPRDGGSDTATEPIIQTSCKTIMPTIANRVEIGLTTHLRNLPS